MVLYIYSKSCLYDINLIIKWWYIIVFVENIFCWFYYKFQWECEQQYCTPEYLKKKKHWKNNESACKLSFNFLCNNIHQNIVHAVQRIIFSSVLFYFFRISIHSFLLFSLRTYTKRFSYRSFTKFYTIMKIQFEYKHCKEIFL